MAARNEVLTPAIQSGPILVQAVPRPILCSPYAEPNDHWHYDTATGKPSQQGFRRPASYWYKTERTGGAQLNLLAQEQSDPLPLVNLLRDDVRKWRESGYPGATTVTRELLAHWWNPDRQRRLFFCQLEAVETIIYLQEIRFAGKTGYRGNVHPHLSRGDLDAMLRGGRPSFAPADGEFYPRLIDAPSDGNLAGLRRVCAKMATGSGKTVVMSMLISWAFVNRGYNPQSKQFPNAVLACCPNLTVKERLQVLRPEREDNYYAQFDIVPAKYRPLLQKGKVLVTNWHLFAPESEHNEGGRNYAVVDKGPETADVFARNRLGDLYERLPILVLNDEGHHCWRPAPSEETLTGEEKKALEEEVREARLWLEGLDRINNCTPEPAKEGGVALCVDLSATPFYIKGSGYPEGRPFPWIVSDFGLVDAIESGIVKIPRLPVQDVTGRQTPVYFALWREITGNLTPGQKIGGRAGRPKPEVVYAGAQGALLQLAGQWAERFRQLEEAKPGQETVPPVLIVVCDNTEIAEVFYRKLSGESEEETVTEAEVAEVLADEATGEETPAPTKKTLKPKKRIVYGKSEVHEMLTNGPGLQRTIRIDSKLEEIEDLRRIVATVGQRGEPGEHVRCVVSVSMLTEGWDANNVTHILGVRAFGSQLLCEQVVGRGLRRMDYVPDPQTGLLTEEYVDVYGIPFSVIPFKSRPMGAAAPEDRPKNHVKALAERSRYEIQYPIVEGYAFALEKNAVRCNVNEVEKLLIEPDQEPTATFVRATVGYQTGHAASLASPFEFVAQDRREYYRNTHLQAIEFMLARSVMDRLIGDTADDKKAKVLRLQSRHQLFPQVFRFVDEYLANRVEWQGCDGRELGLEKYFRRVVERLAERIEPDVSEGEQPLLPVLNRYKKMGSTAEVDFKTAKPCYATQKSHIDQVVLDTDRWEASAAFRLELSAVVECYARNDSPNRLMIPYEYDGQDHVYGPDFLVRLMNGLTILLEVKGYEPDQAKAKHNAARRWVTAVNNWGGQGQWAFHVCYQPHLLEGELQQLSASQYKVA